QRYSPAVLAAPPTPPSFPSTPLFRSVREAFEVVAWDAPLVGAKLHRALAARDRSQHDPGEWDEHPVQNDSNGSAKVALISLERSDRKSTRLNSSHGSISYAVFCLQKN